MKFLVVALVFSLMAGLFFYGLLFYRKVEIAKELSARAVSFTKQGTQGGATMLVLGDSTAVGVGAEHPKDSVAGRLSDALRIAHVENYARSGAVTSDVRAQVQRAQKEKYDFILVGIGGNDIIRFSNAEEVDAELDEILRTLPQAEKVVVYSAGNVGGSKFFPFFLRPYYTKQNLLYHGRFAHTVEEHGGIYVNFYEEPERDPFLREPIKYFSADCLHPSSEGYRLWTEKILEAL